jgi:hypothetical protein
MLYIKNRRVHNIKEVSLSFCYYVNYFISLCTIVCRLVKMEPETITKLCALLGLCYEIVRGHRD